MITFQSSNERELIYHTSYAYFATIVCMEDHIWDLKWVNKVFHGKDYSPAYLSEGKCRR